MDWAPHHADAAGSPSRVRRLTPSGRWHADSGGSTSEPSCVGCRATAERSSTSARYRVGRVLVNRKGIETPKSLGLTQISFQMGLMSTEPSAPSSNPNSPERLGDRVVRVAVAVVYRMESGRPLFFVARRPERAIRGGLWEFPGGKIEPGETPAAAALRELAEEVGLSGGAIVGSPSPLVIVTHTDADLARERSISLESFLVEVRPDARPVVQPSIEVRWITIDELAALEWPRANHAINAAIRARFEG